MGHFRRPRRKNEELRPREFLTGEAVERLREACGDRLGHHAHRDATTISSPAGTAEG
jgi:hypothetical protein